MAWTRIGFGKHATRTLPQVLFTDPDWFFWAYEKGIFDNRGHLLREATVLHAKATSIRIPQTGKEPLQVEYKFYFQNFTSVSFDVVPASQPRHEGSTRTERSDHIDMTVPRRQRNYDKLGYTIFLKSLRHALFKDSSQRMTQRRCEEFFDN